MKKITLLLMMLLMVTFGFSQPSTNATSPTQDESNVISIFSDTYTDLSGVNLNPNWNQSGFATANTSFDPEGNGNLVLAYPNFNYQGIEYAPSTDRINITTMDFLHLDIWIDGNFNPNVYVISTGAEIAHPINNTTPGQWISVDIAVPGITGDLSQTWQFKFDNGNGTSDGIYVDNVFFYDTPVPPESDATLIDLKVDGSTVQGFAPETTDYTYGVSASTPNAVPSITSVTTSNSNATVSITDATAIPGSATVIVTAEDGTTSKNYTVTYELVGPTIAAPTPTSRDDSEVISFYSDAYTQQPLNFDAGFCGTGSTEEIQIDGNNTILYKSNACQGIQLNSPVDASSFTTLNFDLYIDQSVTDMVGKEISLKLVATNGGDPDDFVEVVLNDASSPALVSGEWITVSATLNLTAFTALDEFVITAGTLSEVLYYDNAFLSGGTLSNNTFSKSEFKVYPNPSKGDWNIRTTETIKSVQVYNITGRLVREVNVNASEAVINTNGLSSGVYLAKVSNEFDQTKTIKLIKE